jgi:Ca2+-binding RTX toxin-like protein
VTSGQNVLDGGTGSAFLAGGSGSDTFFLDPGLNQTTRDTLTNFHAGDSVTIWNWVPEISTETVTALVGAAGFQGATLGIADSQGEPVSNITFAGLSATRVSQMETSTGTSGGLSYLHISA